MDNKLFSIINIMGIDSYKFLQGQITANLDDLNNQTHILSAYCNIKGRVIAVFYIYKNAENNYSLLFIGDTAPIFIQKIKKYSLFSKVEFTIVEDITDYLANQFQDLNLSIDYLINNKIPIITKATSELFLPDNINLIDLKAVSFKKGCFLGQEIIARMYYKGKTKQKLHLFKSNTALNNLSAANIYLEDNTVAGQVVFVQDNIGYAVIEDRFLSQQLFLETNSIVVQ